MATFKVSWWHRNGARDTVRPYLTLKHAYQAAVVGRNKDSNGEVTDSRKPLVQVVR